MGLFFEKRESTRPFKVIRHLLIIIILAIFVSAIINDFDFFFMRLLFMFVGISSFFDGIENYYFNRDNKWRYISDFVFGLLWITSSFLIWR
jgi:hypothetical protein